MNRLSELFEKLKIGAEESRSLDMGAVEDIINALQANNGKDISCQISAIERPFRIKSHF